ncbi:MAG: NAD(+) diphosphatase [Desulfobacterales bacterium]|jgi:NAD+ diphosphatase|nr:NAD(+) diphosphatase [Desulfobacterales bacterium]MDD3081002.1 NAD(+) diphosphatase [Desulfobacterales bacterium]MDD3950407.1 NAD(+) diphosphatase [Desulfobacterales bacterium]MDD4463129.1 NAD(+) diphosphatase [Desulfobacterales bacterium]
MNFVPELKHDEKDIRHTPYWFLFQNERLLIHENGPAVSIPCMPDPLLVDLSILHRRHIGQIDGHSCYSAALAEGASPPEGMRFEALRKLFSCLDEPLAVAAGRAAQLLRWDQTNQYCGRCKTPTRRHPTELARICPQCNLIVYPRISPAVIVAVIRGDEILLVRTRRHAPGRFSVVSGFVEPGETPEQCVEREVMEETGIAVKDLCYFGSQAWPFPDSLMLGFTASYAGGEVMADGSEILEAGWFSAGNLPLLPEPVTISRRLIDWFAGRKPA